MQRFLGVLTLGLASQALGAVTDDDGQDALQPHGDRHHGRQIHLSHNHKKARHHDVPHDVPHQDDKVAVAVKPQAVVKSPVAAVATETDHHSADDLVGKMKKIEERLANQAKANSVAKGHLLVNGPLPADFKERFSQAVGAATSVDPSQVTITETVPLEENKDVIEVAFVAPPGIVKAVEKDAADPDSKLASGNMRPYLVAKDEDLAQSGSTSFTAHRAHKPEARDDREEERHEEAPRMTEVTPVQEKGIDIDTQMPYGDLEPFGREDTAQELTESSVKESDEMVDQLERAEVAEEKRAVFRALTRLRGAAITSFDGVARSQTGNIDEYNKVHKWRKTHPLHHLADEESDVTKWAFPDNADF